MGCSNSNKCAVSRSYWYETFEFILYNTFVAIANQFKIHQEGNYQILWSVEICFGRRLKNFILEVSFSFI